MKVNGLVQALSVPLISIAVVLVCGQRAAAGVLVLSGVGGLVFCVVLGGYLLRADGKAERRNEDVKVVATGLAGFLLPAVVAIVALEHARYGGLLFSSEAGAFAGVALYVIPVAILASSMIDHYVILPFCNGQYGPAIWSTGSAPSEERRRRYAQVWVAHRTICEICCYVSLAIVLAIVFVAVGNVVSNERVLAVALESLGGSGVAFTVIAYLGPRVRDGWNYMMAGSAGLGTWADGIDQRNERVQGLVVDVSLHPGVKLRTAQREWRFVPLGEPPHEIEDRRPSTCDEAWAREAVQARETATTRQQPLPPERPTDLGAG